MVIVVVPESSGIQHQLTEDLPKDGQSLRASHQQANLAQLSGNGFGDIFFGNINIHHVTSTTQYHLMLGNAWYVSSCLMFIVLVPRGHQWTQKRSSSGQQWPLGHPNAHIWQPLSSAEGVGPGPDQAAFHLSSKASAHSCGDNASFHLSI